MLYIDRAFINLINFRKFLVFAEIHVSCSNAVWPFASVDGSKSGAQKMNVARSPSTSFSTCITLLFCTRDCGTALPKGGFLKGDLRDSAASWRRNACTWKLRPEECNNFYRIESVDNGADELKAKFCARRNNQKDFALVKTCQLLVVQGDTEGSFIPFHKHFPSVKNHFV